MKVGADLWRGKWSAKTARERVKRATGAHLRQPIGVDTHQVEDLARRSFLEGVFKSGRFGLLVLKRSAGYRRGISERNSGNKGELDLPWAEQSQLLPRQR